jgi:hypothetical protein
LAACLPVRGVPASCVDLERVLPFIFIGVVGGIFALILVAAQKQRKRARENLAKLAQRLGLQIHDPEKRSVFQSATTSLSGTFRGRQLRVFSYSTGSGKNRTQWCAIASSVNNPSGLTVRISRENVFTRVGRKIGVDDVAVGDAAFDREFYVKSNKPDFIRVALIPEVRQRITNFWNSRARGALEVSASEVKYAEVGSFATESVCARFPEAAEVVCDLGEVTEACPTEGR